jgi:hypothetical protein
MNRVLASAKFVAERSKFVKIDEESIHDFCSDFHDAHVYHPLESTPFKMPKLNEAEKMAFLFVFDSQAFCYWGEPKWAIEYQGQQLDGSWAMMASIARAHEDGVPIFDFDFLSGITEKDFAAITKGNVEIPLFNERVAIMRELGSVMKKHFAGDPKNVLQAGDFEAQKLLSVIEENFPNFNDFSIYKDHKVFFFKRAQLLISDIFDVVHADIGNIGSLTGFADYKIPQMLRQLGMLQYAETLAQKVDHRIPIAKDSPEEVEIRAAAILAQELIRQTLEGQGIEIRASHIGHHLWLMSQAGLKSPYHRTRTIAY